MQGLIEMLAQQQLTQTARAEHDDLVDSGKGKRGKMRSEGVLRKARVVAKKVLRLLQQSQFWIALYLHGLWLWQRKPFGNWRPGGEKQAAKAIFQQQGKLVSRPL